LWLVPAAGVTVTLGLILASPVADGDSAQDLVRTLLHTPGLAARPDWRYLPALAALAAVHYVLAGVALRAAAGRGCRTRLRETTLVQLVATVANRVTPSGLGGAAVNSRYLSRRGLSIPEALGAVAGLSLFGGVADALAFVALLLLRAPLGLQGFGSELQALGVRLHQLTAPFVDPPWRIGALAAGLAVLSWLLCRSTRAGRRWPRIADAMEQAGRRATGLMRRPGDLAMLLASSAGTTIVQASALALSVAAVAGSSPAHDLGGLLAGYMVAAAVAGAVPVPAGLGSTEAALVGAVVLAHVSLAHAISAVLLFRLMTFWAPVPVGLLVAPRLRRAGAL
jgi:uncharacterized membrane protein YbhN (UPF0104 family)